MNITDFSIEILENKEKLHLMWMAYIKEVGTTQFLKEIEPYLENNQIWARRLFGFSYTWICGTKDKSKYFELLSKYLK